ncbi:MAG: excinuclease ABC subunit UvrC [Alphaproteobacteria bacterium]
MDQDDTAPPTDQPADARQRGRSLAAGLAFLNDELRRLPSAPGVYRMVNRAGDALYVGKAKNLKKRVAAYTKLDRLPERLRRMVAETVQFEVVKCHTEVEALLLEANLIKKLKPRYNVLLRDDKSFPHIVITAQAGTEGPHAWARLMKYRGQRGGADEYFGPFASAGAVNRTLGALQRAFLLRTCSDTVFATRARPCLLYQIKKCSGPCVGRIAPADYATLVQQAKDFLHGRNNEIQRDLARRMEAASDAQEFEQAAFFRDRIQALTQIQARQDINMHGIEDADVIAAHREGDVTCIQIFFYRGGRNYGNRAYYPRHDKQEDVDTVLSAFLGQFYADKPPARLILIAPDVPERALIQAALTEKAGHKVEIAVPQRGERKKLTDHTLANAKDALARHLAESSSQLRLLDGVAQAFGLEAPPERIEVYDNSHVSGTHAVGAMIVAGPQGFIKNAYRKFNMRGDEDAAPAPVTGGDDYAMMREMLGRRFGRALREDPERARGTWPDLVIIDGGPGQLSSALAVFADLGIEDVAIVAMAKGPDRNAGREVFHLRDGGTHSFDRNDPVLYFLQRLRDEAHRFAIGAHRTRRGNALVQSALDEVPGIGAKRKRALLLHFGSARGVAAAGLADLEKVPGISGAFAKKIYDYFHDGR